MSKPNIDFTSWGPVTVLLVAITAIAACAGAVTVVIHPETLSFEQLLNDLEKFAIALGLLGVGRGIHAGLTNVGTLASPSPGVQPDISDTHGLHDHPEGAATTESSPSDLA
jgi:hypothetical protein